jgi:hypothetical protein
MKAFSVVRFRVKPGRENEFVQKNREMNGRLMKGFISGALIKTGERKYCFIGEWENFNAIVAARSEMIGILDTFRDTLEDLGGDLGVTDPVSGEAVAEITSQDRP